MNRFRPAVLFVLLLLCLGCRQERAPAPAAARTVDDTKPQDGGTVVRRLESDISTLNPILLTTSYDHYISFYLFEPLLQYNSALEVMPALADKWQVSADGKEYTFHIDPKAMFSDRTPVRASDVKASYRDGVLEIHVPKAEEAKTREIPIHIG